MRKMLLPIAMILVAGIAFAGVHKGPRAVTKVVHPDAAVVLQKPGPVVEKLASVGPGDSVGFTYYDYGSNGGARHNIINFGDGTLAIGQMAAQVAAGTADRGTWYTYFDGTSWSAIEKVEAARRGWGNIDQFKDFGGTEITVSHVGPRVNVHGAKGSGTWTETVLGTTGTWPRFAAGTEANVHFWMPNGTPDTVFYCRSVDGGASLDISFLPVIDAGSHPDAEIGADGYDIAVKGQMVALLHAGRGGDMYLKVSTDNGSTWTSTTISDVVPAAENEEKFVCDGSAAVIIDGNDKVHVVWANYLGVAGPTGRFADSLFYSQDAPIMYWSEATGAMEIAMPIQDTTITTDGWGGGTNGNFAMVPDIALDASNNLYVTFWQVISETNDSGWNYAHLYGLASTDNGATWTAARDLTPGTGFDVTWASMADLVDENAHITAYVDPIPGNSLQGNHEVIPVALKYMKVPAASFTATSVEPVRGTTPESFSLSQNYPNPFNPSTKIQYSITNGAFVTLKVYDMLGREVSTLVNQQQNAGVYEATFDASNLANGAYVYKLQAGSFTQVKTMMLLK